MMIEIGPQLAELVKFVAGALLFGLFVFCIFR